MGDPTNTPPYSLRADNGKVRLDVEGNYTGEQHLAELANGATLALPGGRNIRIDGVKNGVFTIAMSQKDFAGIKVNKDGKLEATTNFEDRQEAGLNPVRGASPTPGLGGRVQVVDIHNNNFITRSSDPGSDPAIAARIMRDVNHAIVNKDADKLAALGFSAQEADELVAKQTEVILPSQQGTPRKPDNAALLEQGGRPLISQAKAPEDYTQHSNETYEEELRKRGQYNAVMGNGDTKDEEKPEVPNEKARKNYIQRGNIMGYSNAIIDHHLNLSQATSQAGDALQKLMESGVTMKKDEREKLVDALDANRNGKLDNHDMTLAMAALEATRHQGDEKPTPLTWQEVDREFMKAKATPAVPKGDEKAPETPTR